MKPYPTLIVASPLGVGIVLGLIQTWPTTLKAQPGQYYNVVQVAAGGTFAENLDQLSRAAEARGLGHISDLAPWPFFTPGPCGLVLVAACRHRPEGHYVYHLDLAEPLPAWSKASRPRRSGIAANNPEPRTAAPAGFFPLQKEVA